LTPKCAGDAVFGLDPEDAPIHHPTVDRFPGFGGPATRTQA